MANNTKTNSKSAIRFSFPTVPAIKLSRYSWLGCSPWFPRARLQAALHFVSGVNRAGEVSGLADNAFNIGITCGEISTDLRGWLELYADRVNQRLFVDSGAFSEVDFPKDAPPVVVRPLTDADWRERLFDVYRWAARTYGRRAFVVAPDCVGNQDETLRRLEKYTMPMRQIARAATVIIPVQKGALSMARMFEISCALLELDAAHVVAGIPMMKDATSLEDVEAFARSLPAGARVHLLGIGPKAKYNRYELALAALKRGCPTIRVTSDSAVLVSIVGRTNGRGGKPRALTLYQDVARADGANARGTKDVAISMWRKDLYSIEDAFQARACAGELGVG